MREVPASIIAAWYSGTTIGDMRPMVRVTVQHPQMRLVNTGDNLFASYLFGTQQGTPKELPNVLSFECDRGVENDVDTGTLTLLNVAPLPIGEVPPTEDFDLLGHYTPQRGKSAFSSRWNHEPNEWAEALMPDNLIRTYEGYGFDAEVCPSSDPNLVQTGVWSIVKAKFTHDGRIVVELQGLEGPLLNDQIAYPPVVPFSAGPVAEAYPKGKYAYPVQFQAENPDPIINRTTHVNEGTVQLEFDDSSNTPYISSEDATYRGHRLRDAFDGDPDSYWLSVGNARNDQGYSYEWVQASMSATSLSSVRFQTVGSGYTAYIGVYVDGEWQTSAEGGLVPYDPDNPISAPNFADENYVTALPVTSEGWTEVDLPEVYEGATKVRITFGNLWDSNLGPYQYRAGVRTVEAYAPGSTTVTETVTTFDLKNYGDYCADEVTEILTQRGWLTQDDLREGDLALAIDPSTGVAGWQVVESIYRKHYDSRPMVSMESQVHSSLTTHDHRWLVTDQQGRRHWRTTETLATGHRIPVAAPVETSITTTKYSDDLVELVAWFWTEGWESTDGSISIAQSDVANPESVESIRAALTREIGPAGRGRWGESRRGDGVITFRVSREPARTIRECAPDKVLAPAFLTLLSRAQLDLLIERSIDADGWRSGHVGISQANEERTKGFEMALALAGRPFRTRERDGMFVTVLLKHGVTMPQSAKVEEVEYSGTIWCPTLRHHNWLARRNGTVYFTGNTDIVKLFLAWAGFFWPENAYELDCDGNQMPRTWTKPDNCLPIDGAGRVWGDFKLSGTYGPATLGVELFEKKPLLDCIKYIQDILGYVFFIDETGGAVFRPPNIYRLGNWIRSLTRSNGRRSGGAMPRIDERVSLRGLESVLDGSNQRERTFVSNTDGTLGAMAAGFVPNDTGLRRVGGWTDQNFETQGEVNIMADMITLRQLFTYRQDQIQIKGNPQIQVDDQVQVYERVTNEGYVHYVRSIKSNNDLVSGEWTYDLTTHWLGERPFERWLFDPAQLRRETRRYLEELYIATGEEQV